MDKRQRLEDLMLRYALRRRDVARLLDKPLNSAGGYSNSTVDRWLGGDHEVPSMALELLELKLSDQPERPDPWQRLVRQPVPYASQREMEDDLRAVLAAVEEGDIPRAGRGGKEAALRRAGYWLELFAHFGGPGLRPWRGALLEQAHHLRRRVDLSGTPVLLRAGDGQNSAQYDDLARNWGLAAGADLGRFRQLASTGHV